MAQQMDPTLLKDMNFDTFVKTHRFYHGFRESPLGQHVHNDCGIISDVHQKNDFDCFANLNPYFQGNLRFVLPV